MTSKDASDTDCGERHSRPIQLDELEHGLHLDRLLIGLHLLVGIAPFEIGIVLDDILGLFDVLHVLFVHLENIIALQRRTNRRSGRSDTSDNARCDEDGRGVLLCGKSDLAECSGDVR